MSSRAGRRCAVCEEFSEQGEVVTVTPGRDYQGVLGGPRPPEREFVCDECYENALPDC